MKVSEYYANNFFRADDFDKVGRVLTIFSVEMEQVGKEEKLTIHFVDEDKTLPVNKTNALSIAELYGDDTDDWCDKEIRIFRDITMFNGKRVSCMRVGNPESSPSGKGRGRGRGSASPSVEQK